MSNAKRFTGGLLNMRYIGSKTSTLPWLSELVGQRAPLAASLCDPFAGTCTVSRHFKSRGLKVVTGDVLRLSYVFQVATVRLNEAPTFEGLFAAGALPPCVCPPADTVLEYLNQIPGVRGYVYENFSPGGVAQRLFFSRENASKIDAIRQVITNWKYENYLSENEECYLLAALIDAADRVANTAGTYYAYLKKFTRKSLLPLRLNALPTTTSTKQSSCHQIDARNLTSQDNSEILYLDPPYNSRNYRGYYHLPEAIASLSQPEARGKSGVPLLGGSPSDFCRPSAATMALAEICEKTRAKHIIVHYANDGIISHDSICEILSRRGNLRCDELNVRAYSSKSETNKSAKHMVYWCDVGKF